MNNTQVFKNQFQRAYSKCSQERNPIVLIAKVSILLGYISVLYPYQLIKKAITEKEINIIEKLYSIFVDKIIRVLSLDRETVRVHLVTTFKQNDKIVSEEKNLFHINGMNNKIIYISKEYDFRIHKTSVTFRFKVVADLCCTLYDYYIRERDIMDMPIYLPKLRKMVFACGFILLNSPAILFI